VSGGKEKRAEERREGGEREEEIGRIETCLSKPVSGERALATQAIVNYKAMQDGFTAI
jgi:hypothetical protein